MDAMKKSHVGNATQLFYNYVKILFVIPNNDVNQIRLGKLEPFHFNKAISIQFHF